MRSAQVRIARSLASATYTQKWLVLGTVVGIIAGLGAVVFYEALRLATEMRPFVSLRFQDQRRGDLMSLVYAIISV